MPPAGMCQLYSRACDKRGNFWEQESIHWEELLRNRGHFPLSFYVKKVLTFFIVSEKRYSSFSY